MTNLHQRFPWIASIICAVLFLALALAGTPLGNQIERSARLPVNSGILIQQLLLALFSALAVTLFGGWRAAGFAKWFDWRALLLYLPPLVGPVIILLFTGIAATDVTQLVMLVVFTAMIGFAEEALCRGVMVNAFLPRGMLKAALYSSLIFGSMHLVNLFYGMNPGMALLYVVYAALIGFGFAAPYLRSGGAIWPAIGAHALYDFIGKVGHGWGAQAQPTSSTEAVIRLVVAILVGLYGIWLLRTARAGSQTSRPLVGEAAQ